MKIVTNAEFPQDLKDLVYNGLDSLATYELKQVMDKAAPQWVQPIYDFHKKFIGPTLTMSRRGIRVDVKERDKTLGELWPRLQKLSGMGLVANKKGVKKWKIVDEDALLQQFAKASWGKCLNPNSDKDKKDFFYKHLGCKEILKNKKGKTTLKIDIDALESLGKTYVKAKPFVNILIKYSDIRKQIELLSKSLLDERYMYSYIIGGTKNGRLSSKANNLYIGANIQNIDPALRHVFKPDDGKCFISADLKGAEAVVIAYKSGDENYIKAVAGDVHTQVASMVWGFEPDRKLADREYYRGFSYRDMCKKFAHGSNLGGKARTLASQAHVETKLVEEFQEKYFATFPGILAWQNWTSRELQEKGYLINPLGFRREFFGRVWSDDVLRDGLSFIPQSTVSMLTMIGEYKLWKKHQGQLLELLMNGHDSTLIQVLVENLDEGIEAMQKELTIEVPVTDINGIERMMTIPVECKSGFSWGDRIINKDGTVKNDNGLWEYGKPR